MIYLRYFLLIFIITLNNCTNEIVVGGDMKAQGLKEVYWHHMPNAEALAGFNNVVAVIYSRYDETFYETLNLYRYSEEAEDKILFLGSLKLNSGYHWETVVNLTDNYAVITMYEFDYPYEHNIILISLENLPDFSISAKFDLDWTALNATVSGNYLLAVNESYCYVYDISNLSELQLKKKFPVSSTIKSIVAVNSVFFITTADGYIVIDVSDPANISFNEKNSDDFKNITKLIAVDNILYMASQTETPGKIKIAKADISDLQNPQISLIKNDIEGIFQDFSFDGGENYALLADGIENDERYTLRLYTEKNTQLSLKETYPYLSSIHSQMLYAKQNYYYILEGDCIKVYTAP